MPHSAKNITTEDKEQAKSRGPSKNYAKIFLRFVWNEILDWLKRYRVPLAVSATWCTVIALFVMQAMTSDTYARGFWILKLLGSHLSSLYLIDRFINHDHRMLGLFLLLFTTILLALICVALRRVKSKSVAVVIIKHLFRCLCFVPILFCVTIGVLSSTLEGTVESRYNIDRFLKRSEQYGAFSKKHIPSFQELITKINTDPNFYDKLPVARKLVINKLVDDYITLQNGPLTLEQHLLRNHINIAPPTLKDMLSGKTNERKLKWNLLSPLSSAYHMFGKDGEYNLKFVSSDGHYEAVYDKHGRLLTDKNGSINMGTYNYAGHGAPSWGHSQWDVAPYYVYGNTGKKPGFTNEDIVNNLERFFRNHDAQKRYDKIKAVVKKVYSN
jgi:hypothetical protein